MNSLEKKYNRTAPFYDLFDYPFERWRYQALRRKLWRPLSGIILDAGVGTGCNVPYYPPEAKIIAVDQSERMLARARDKVALSPAEVSFQQENIYDLPFAESTFDYVVGTFLCCVVDEPKRAAKELSRVCKPNGQILLLEYVLSQKFLRRNMQKLFVPYTKFCFGVNFKQDTLATLKQVGCEIEQADFWVDDVLQYITARPEGK